MWQKKRSWALTRGFDVEPASAGDIRDWDHLAFYYFDLENNETMKNGKVSWTSKLRREEREEAIHGMSRSMEQFEGRESGTRNDR